MARNTPVTPPGTYAVGSVPVNGTILASLARAVAAYTTAEMPNYKGRGLRLFVNISNANAGTVNVKVQVKDHSSGTWLDLPGATTGDLTVAGAYEFTIGAGSPDVPGQSISTPLGAAFRIVATVTVATVTFSVGGEYVG